MNTFSLTNPAQSIPHLSNNWKLLLDHTQAENAAESFRKITKYLIPNLPAKLPEYIRYYLHYNFSNFTLRELQKNLNTPSFQIIAYGNQTAKNALEMDNQLNDILKYCINQQLNT